MNSHRIAFSLLSAAVMTFCGLLLLNGTPVQALQCQQACDAEYSACTSECGQNTNSEGQTQCIEGCISRYEFCSGSAYYCSPPEDDNWCAWCWGSWETPDHFVVDSCSSTQC